MVYHLFGRVSASPTYVISDEDLLEFICALQSEHLAPEKLFYELEHSHLLFIGSNFTNWLARLFLRMAKRQRLSDPRDVGEIMADDHTSEDERLVSFLQQVSVRTRIYQGAERFVDELHERLAARRKPAGSAAPASAPVRFLPPARDMPDNAVFISYAREDLHAVQQIKADLEAAGITTWFDMDRLESGDDYDRKIQRNIARCSYFIPVVSPRPRSGASRATSAASGATRWTACATWPTARCSSCRSRSTAPPPPRRWCPTSSRRCTSRSYRAARCRPSSRSAWLISCGPASSERSA